MKNIMKINWMALGKAYHAVLWCIMVMVAFSLTGCKDQDDRVAPKQESQGKIIYNGREVTMDEIRRSGKQEMTFIAGVSESDKNVVYAFDNDGAFLAWARTTKDGAAIEKVHNDMAVAAAKARLKSPEQLKQGLEKAGRTEVLSNAAFYEHIYYGGIWLSTGYNLPDLRWYGWNDRISSVANGSNSRYVVLCEHIHYGGYKFYVAPYRNYPDLRWYWWNDLVSSIYGL